MWNLRGYARFLFSQGKIQLGRSKYEEALSTEIDDTDYSRREITDTYILWAKAEKDFNNIEEASRLIKKANGSCSRIGNDITRNEMAKHIEMVTREINDNTTSN